MLQVINQVAASGTERMEQRPFQKRESMKGQKSKRNIALCICVVVLASCVSYRPPVSNYSDVKYHNINNIVTNIPVVADLKVKQEKVQGIYKGRGAYDRNAKKYIFDFDEAKHLAAVDAIEKYGADILLEPMFTVETIRGDITVSVTGYVATYSNFRSATKEDAELLKAGGELLKAGGEKAIIIDKRQ